jgi:hypothetical protein
MKMKNSSFQTRDLPMAAFLVTIGYPLLAYNRIGTILFFESPEAAANDAPSYMQGAEVAAREFYASLRDLKSLIHSGQEQATNMKMKKENRIEHKISRHPQQI